MNIEEILESLNAQFNLFYECESVEELQPIKKRILELISAGKDIDYERTANVTFDFIKKVLVKMSELGEAFDEAL